MSNVNAERLLEALLDSWDRNNTILVNLLRALPERGLESGRHLDVHYDHPILFLQHMIWHEGHHHGQIKLALKRTGHPIADDAAGPVTWDVWMRKQTAE